jgi:hypothetical protein
MQPEFVGLWLRGGARTMRKRIAHTVAFVLCAATLALITSAVLLATLNKYDLWELTIFIGIAVAALVACMITAHRPANSIGWFIAASALCFSVGEFARQYALYGVLTAPGSLPWARVMAWPVYWVWYPGIFLSFFFVPLYFPNGRLVSPRWRSMVWFALVVAALGTGLNAVQSGDVETPGIPNPLAVDGLPPSDMVGPLFFLLFVGLMVTGGLSLVLRFRRAGGEERQQIKWFVYAIVLFVCYVVVRLVFQVPIVVDALISIILWMCPWVAIAIAVLHYRLYDIDVIINCTLVYGSLTAALVLVYIGCVVLLQQLLGLLAGSSELAIVASTLTIAALFNPLRKRIQTSIDKRFYRRKYDAAKVLAAFGATARDETDLERLAGELLRVVDETMQPEFVSLWLRETQAGSTPDSARPASTPSQ